MQARHHQIKSPARSPVGTRQHHAGTRPLKRTADLVTEIGAGNLRGVGEKSRARARGTHQRWAALPGRGVPRARARRDARRRPATRTVTRTRPRDEPTGEGPRLVGAWGGQGHARFWCPLPSAGRLRHARAVQIPEVGGEPCTLAGIVLFL